MTAKETPEARAERILAELRAATAEAAGLLKDLRAAAKAAREQCEGYINTRVQADMQAWQEQMQADMESFFLDFDRHALEVGTAATERAVRAIDKAVEIEGLAEALAVRMAAIYKRTPEGRSALDFGGELSPNLMITGT